MTNKFELFVNTLNLILLPNKEIEISYSKLIQSQLEELEGDFYTFLHKDFVFELFINGYISNRAVEKIQEVRLKILQIDSSYWNVDSFIDHPEWEKVRFLVIDLLRNDFNN